MTPYLIVATDYSLSCRGTCPTCVLDAAERHGAALPAIAPQTVISALHDIAAKYGAVGTLALGIGRANTLALENDVARDIAAMAQGARAAFPGAELAVEISTSLIGRLDTQIARATTIAELLIQDGIEARFVIVGNTTLLSDKYWANIETFLAHMAKVRGGGDGSGDILQLSVAIGHLPDPDRLVARLAGLRSPVNLTWAPVFDQDAVSEARLADFATWLASFYRLSEQAGLDSSLVTRTRQAFALGGDIGSVPAHIEGSSRSVLFIAPDGAWHQGLFTVLAEMDPIRFDPCSHRGKNGLARITGDARDDVRRLRRNPCCATCPYFVQCGLSGAHKIALMVLKRHEKGTLTCPSGLKACFALEHDRQSLKGSLQAQ